MNIVLLLYHPSALTNWVAKLVPYLKDYQVSVLHVAKLHKVVPTVVKGVELYDVSGYTYSQAEKLVRTLSPDVFIFLSFRSILELTYHRICTKLCIKKIYVEHGLFSGDTLRFRTNKLKKEFFVMFKRQACFLFTHLGWMFQSGNIFEEAKLFYNVYRRGNFYLVPYDHYYLFSKRSFDNYSKLFSMNESENVTYMGYPIFTEESQKAMAEVKKGGGVLYVHQPLVFDGLAHISFGEEKQWLLDVACRLEPKYGKFTILLHPRGDLEAYTERFRGTNIEVVKAPNNFRLFADKDLIVGHYSTALLYGLYFGKPTLVLDYPTTHNDPLFAELFTYVENVDLLGTVAITLDESKKLYMVGEHNTFEYIANTLVKDYDIH